MIVLLPGLHGTADLFKPLLSVMPSHLSTSIISYPTDRICSYASLLEMVEAQLKNEVGMVLVAESFSGPLALRFAAANASRVRAIVLCGSFVRPPVPRLLCYLATPMILIRFPIPDVAIRTFLSGFRAPRALVRETRRVIRSIRPLVLADRVRQMAWIDGRDALRFCQVPILWLAGSRDRLIGGRATRHMQRIRPDVPIKRIDAPHFLLEVKPVDVWRECSQFLKAHGVDELAMVGSA